MIKRSKHFLMLQNIKIIFTIPSLPHCVQFSIFLQISGRALLDTKGKEKKHLIWKKKVFRAVQLFVSI